MIPTTFVFHTDFSDQNQMIHFLKNLSMMGGLLYAFGFGPGGISLDAKQGRTGDIDRQDRMITPGYISGRGTGT